ncbi:MAG: hypothetical protein GC205_13295 [Bacteroidetes bacterium]|nr:hypothetical protein [Bacteroidota bacterium]
MDSQNIKELQQQFITKLTLLFGDYDPAANKFIKSSNSDIARDLSYSDAQFSRLTHGSASEGEYVRGLRLVDRMLQVRELEQMLAAKEAVPAAKENHPPYKQLLLASSILIGVMLVLLLLPSRGRKAQLDDQQPMSRDYTLNWAFGTSFINPYVKLKDLPENCDFRSYRYQGVWHLEKPYKIPLFRERNGFHYLAHEVNMYARSMSEQSSNGEFFEGYEYQLHEIWYDTRELPIDSFLQKSNPSLTRTAYQDLNLEEDENFVKVALVHTFFRNEFKIDSVHITRRGKVIGRDVELVNMATLVKSLGSKTSADDIANEIKLIVDKKLEDFSRPIDCNQTEVPQANFHLVEQGSTMSFNCVLTTGRFPIQYTKTYVLADQFIKNICR